MVHQPPTNDKVAYRSSQPWNRREEARAQNVEMQRGIQISRQPGEKQVEVVVVGGHAERQAPNFFSPQQKPQRRSTMLIDRNVFCAVRGNVFALRHRQQRILGRVPIHKVEQYEIAEAEYTGEKKTHPPSPVMDDHGDQRNADSRGELRTGVEDGGRKSALAARKPYADSFGISRKRRRFSDS